MKVAVRINLLILLTIILMPSEAFSNQKTLHFNDTIDKYSIYDYTYYYEDTSKNVTIDSILDSHYNFNSTEDQRLNFGFTENPFWIKFSIKNPTQKKKTLYLILANPDLNFIDFYETSDDSVIKSVHTGQARDFEARDIKNRNFVFELPLKPNKTHTFYLRSQNNGDANFLPLFLYNFSTYLHIDSNLLWFKGIIFGLCLFMILYNLFLFIKINQRIYLYYFFYLIFGTIILLLLNGFASQYLWNANLWRAANSIPVFMLLGLFFLLLFSKNFLSVRKFNQKIRFIFDLLLYFTFILGVLSIHKDFFIYGVYGLSILTPIIFIFCLFLSVKRIRQNEKPAFYLFGAFSLTIIGFLIHISRDAGFLPPNHITLNALSVGFIGEMFVLSLAVIDRFQREQKRIQNQLIKAKEKAQESDRLKSTFLANMDHEIRTPMNSIIGFTELLERIKVDDQKKDQYTTIIKNQGRHLINLINDVLDLAKIEAGILNMHSHHFTLNNLLHEIYIKTKHNLEEENADIELYAHYGLEGRDSIIIADKARLRQIINNLLSNAVKFTEMGMINFGYKKYNARTLLF